MSDNLTDIWRSQPTPSLNLSVAELRQRVKHLEERVTRRRNIGLTVALVNLAAWIVDLLFFFDGRRHYFWWLITLQMISYIVLLVYQGTPSLSDRGQFITLRSPEPAIPCLEFYRNQLTAFRASLRRGRLVLIGAAATGVFFVWISTWAPKPGLLPTGIVLFVGGVVWYAVLRRAIPPIESELAELESSKKLEEQ